MNTKVKLLFCLLALLFATGAIGHVAAEGVSGCDPAYVTQDGDVMIVRPTGVDDTVNIQCAFDTAVSANLDVHFTSGTFHTAQIVVENFMGAFTGNGKYATRIENLPNLYVTPEDVIFEAPSAENPWPTLFAFIDGDFQIADLGVSIVGDEPTAGWTIFGIDPPLKEMAGGIYVLGTEAHVLVERVRITGEANPDAGFLYGYNLINATYFEGVIGAVPPPISGSFAVYDSVFRAVAAGTALDNLSGAEVIASRNKYFDSYYGAGGGGYVDSSITFSDNYVDAKFGVEFYDLYVEEFANTTLVIANNKFHGSDTAVGLYATFGDNMHCLLLDNKFQSEDGLDIFLGAATSNCFVVGDRLDVIDLGTNNVIIGRGNTISYE